MNNFDLNTNSVNELKTWLRGPRLFGLIIFDTLIVLMTIYWTQTYIKYLGFILLMIYINMLFNNPVKTPTVLKQYLGIATTSEQFTDDNYNTINEYKFGLFLAACAILYIFLSLKYRDDYI